MLTILLITSGRVNRKFCFGDARMWKREIFWWLICVRGFSGFCVKRKWEKRCHCSLKLASETSQYLKILDSSIEVCSSLNSLISLFGFAPSPPRIRWCLNVFWPSFFRFPMRVLMSMRRKVICQLVKHNLTQIATGFTFLPFMFIYLLFYIALYFGQRVGLIKLWIIIQIKNKKLSTVMMM